MGEARGDKLRIARGLPVGAEITCADNTGAKRLRILSVIGFGASMNRLPAGAPGDMVNVSVRKGSPKLRKTKCLAVIIRQRKMFRRIDGTFIYFEDNAGVIVNKNGTMEGSTIIGPVAKECVILWPNLSKHAVDKVF